MQPKVYFASDHDIDPDQIDADALFVLKKLRDAGFTAYLVGGSVRDLLVKKKPKDFDVSTSAEPEQIKKIFQRSCILIGRRFRLAHIRFGKKVIEVATFRSGESDGDLILQDNRWGTEEEDVLRRDFTINGLYYDPSSHSVIDYVGGWEDIHKGILRSIGDSKTRFKEDPVRMIRLLKFKARFGFDIDTEATQALLECKEEIVKSSPARILEELLRMLESGAATPFFQLMSENGLLDLLFPKLNQHLASDIGKRIYALLSAADKINQAFGAASLERAVIASCLIFPVLQHEIQNDFINQNKHPHLGEVIMISSSLIKSIVISSFSHFPRRIAALMGYILSSQFRLTPTTGKVNYRTKVIRHREFVLALKFLKLRSLANEQLIESYNAWKKVYRHEERHDRRPHPHRAPTVKAHHHAAKA